MTRDSLVTVTVGQPQPLQAIPAIKANSTAGSLTLNQGDAATVTVELDPGDCAGAAKDWWVVACDSTRNQWYYLNSSITWIPFDGNLAACQPAYQGALFDLTSTAVLNSYVLPSGTFVFYFAVDTQDGILNFPDGPIQYDYVTLTVNE